ncbi:RiPP maturation radical SAM C-methyltransferase [Bradyrhizobium prioriisuperbiae]|uniref:RiPP maturation radical SAM C-methyltransferase n=1 Tax=Bradyrhizobium prioriisuperbiae TaxID=2854389 RepID=UPI0028E1BBC1|nr:RiPP maturation radical SAM C-methyltransferase [Bradyrhizobium prioritasuperba]
MPFYSVRTPSPQLGLLSAIGEAQGFSVDTLHLNLDFAARVGRDFYEALCAHRGPEVGNWLFAPSAFRDDAPDREALFPHHFPVAVGFADKFGFNVDALKRMRHELVPAFLDHAESVIDTGRYDVIGFTCTYQQNVASLALARRLKERVPGIVTLFGGANFEGAMGRELLRSFTWIDYIIDGEADEAFPAFLAAVGEGTSPSDVPGVFARSTVATPAKKLIADLDRLPIPSYGEFFRHAEELGLIAPGERPNVPVPIETSRGCWWGQKHHCTFCGLNGSTMTYRQKSSGRVLAELAELTRRHGIFRYDAVDNIMPASFFRDLVPAIASEERHYELFFEVKANISRAQVKLLRDAGIRSIQPGIESLSSHVLQLMDKGVRAAHNVNLLRWGRYYGVAVWWNLLWGFPGERAEDYQQQAALLPHLVHLQPPESATRVWLERFSPLYFDRTRFPVQSLRPEASLAYIYPGAVAREQIAYFFEHVFPDELAADVLEPIRAGVTAWSQAWAADRKRPWLTFRWSPGFLQIDDGRDPTSPQFTRFEDPFAQIYRAIADRPLSAANIRETLGLSWSADDIAAAMDLFANKGLVMCDNELYLALAIPSDAPRDAVV